MLSTLNKFDQRQTSVQFWHVTVQIYIYDYSVASPKRFLTTARRVKNLIKITLDKDTTLMLTFGFDVSGSVVED